ncbi:MAG: TPM domain-containing protein [Clostridia bacterium]|nr:TPM domain-containing protein [Clostridia bacterium]
MKKTLIITVLAIILSLIMPIISFASPDMPPYPVVDEADVMSDYEEDRLVNKLIHLIKEHRMDFAIVIINDLGTETPYSYADSYYHNNGRGFGKDKSGVLLLLALNTRDYYIYTYGEAEDEFGDSELTELEDAMLPHLRKDEFYKGFMAYADACDSVLSFDVIWSLLIAAIIGAVISLIIVFSMKSKLKSVRPQKTASNYVRSGSFVLTKDLDLYLYRTIVRTRRADTNSGSRGSGGGSRGGGRGGKF